MESPPYNALINFVPTARVEVENVAVPLLRVPVPKVVVPCSKVMISPSGGVPLPEEVTFAVNTTV